jgi:hypothetical protein
MAVPDIAWMALRAWVSQTDVGWILNVPTTDLWWYTGIPLVLCFIAVNLFFRHIITVTWFSMKLAIAGMVYISARQFIITSMPDNPISIDSTLLDIPPGTIDIVSSAGMQLITTHATAIFKNACPSCFTPPPPPPTPPEGVQRITTHATAILKNACPSCFTPPPPPPPTVLEDTWIEWVDVILSL